jgi:hypothetical protein
MTWDRQHSLLQNVAAISGDFHTHKRYWEFYQTFGRHIDGFVGQYEICIEMAKALTDWEAENGGEDAYANTADPWIEIVEQFIDSVIAQACDRREIPNLRYVLRHLGAEKARAP